MALTSLRQILDHAAEHSYGMPAFNVTNLESILAVLSAAEKTNSPALIQVSQSARKYADDYFLAAMFVAAARRYPDVPLCVHQDHGSSPAVCREAMGIGCSSVMMDGSLEADGKTPSSYEYNVNVTVEVVRLAHAQGVSVEGELGVLGSLETGGGEQEDGHGVEGTLSRVHLLTDPDQALDFVKGTGVDALAVAIGTSHGAYKFSRKPTGDLLALDVIAAIHAKLPNTHLVMHGASEVPKELQDLINANGGAIPETYGVPTEEVVKSIRHGVRKVNIDTDLRMAMTGSVREYLKANPKSIDVRAMNKGGIQRMEKLCIDRFEQFGAAGKANSFKSIPLADMAKRYVDGSLRQV
ncbi:fructose-bisphosphate aldolase, class II, Calvin cycle subtype [Rhizobium leguminosarum bv. trifolii WSM2012]|nr:fructose-bisphosphate aldolase, class II, Calvin cycle subtype [Rhizobium leguminosarum bv. trifolii WSM2012]EJC76924.1 fructose-bisphosphate aldolase, class II, Calvin cycle subtype [Rhizobium leguminosarum bv. trifolii WSM2012]